MDAAYKKLDKVVINVGLGRLSANSADFESKLLPEIMNELSAITGQKPSTRPAKKSIAGFKLRMGMPVGLKVTLRKNRKKEFLQKLTNIAIPRVRDFRGIDENSIDKNGNLTIGFKEHVTFPEVSPETSKVSFGLQVTLVPKIQDKTKALELYKALGIPFKK